MLITQIKKDRMIANKDGNKQKYEVLTTLLSEVQRLEKIDQENDAKVQAVCKKYVKGLDDMVTAHCMGCDDKNAGEMPATLASLVEEKKIVEAYLPKQLSYKDLTIIICDIAKHVDAQSMKEMGKVMKALKEKYDGQYDGKLASQIVRELLS